MDNETLERLILDRSLGVLPRDCEALLGAYLKTHPETETVARDFDETVQLARHTLGGAEVESLPAFPAQRAISAGRRRLIGAVAAVAASTVIGVAVGAWLFSGAPTVRETPSAVARQEVHNDSGQFWSARRLYENASAERRERTRELIWDSPVKRPRTGDNT